MAEIVVYLNLDYFSLTCYFGLPRKLVSHALVVRLFAVADLKKKSVFIANKTEVLLGRRVLVKRLFIQLSQLGRVLDLLVSDNIKILLVLKSPNNKHSLFMSYYIPRGQDPGVLENPDPQKMTKKAFVVDSAVPN